MENNSKVDMYFDDILSLAMEDAGIGCMALEDLLKEKGDKIQFQAISAYARGTLVPRYERAKKLLDVLDVPMDEKELMDVLARTRERQKQQKQYFKEEETEIRKTITIRIKPKNISPGLTVYQGVRILEERIEDLFGSENKFSDYVKMLIMKDLREFILNKEDVELEKGED